MTDDYRIVVADDHNIFRQGMKRLINEVPGLQVVGEASDGFELLSLLEKVETDLVLLDISMPGHRGIEAAREITKRYPRTAILFLTMHKTKEYLHHAISAGARGYLLKEDSDLELITAIETIRKGDVYVTRLLASEVSEDLLELSKGNIRSLVEPLSTREKEIVKLIAEGKSNKDIADIFAISIRTVESHRANIMKKLDLNNTAELVRYAFQNGLTELDV